MSSTPPDRFPSRSSRARISKGHGFGSAAIRPELPARPARPSLSVRPHAHEAGGGVRGAARERADEARRRDRCSRSGTRYAFRPVRGEATRPGRQASRSSLSARPISARLRAKTSRASATGGLTSRASASDERASRCDDVTACSGRRTGSAQTDVLDEAGPVTVTDEAGPRYARTPSRQGVFALKGQVGFGRRSTNRLPIRVDKPHGMPPRRGPNGTRAASSFRYEGRSRRRSAVVARPETWVTSLRV